MTGMAGYAWINFLTDPDGIFCAFPTYFENIADGMKVSDWWRYKIEHVLFGCEKCAAGQIALWSYILVYPEKAFTIEHAFTIILAVFFGGLTHDIWQKYLR